MCYTDRYVVYEDPTPKFKSAQDIPMQAEPGIVFVSSSGVGIPLEETFGLKWFVVNEIKVHVGPWWAPWKWRRKPAYECTTYYGGSPSTVEWHKTPADIAEHGLQGDNCENGSTARCPYSYYVWKSGVRDDPCRDRTVPCVDMAGNS